MWHVIVKAGKARRSRLSRLFQFLYAGTTFLGPSDFTCSTTSKIWTLSARPAAVHHHPPGILWNQQDGAVGRCSCCRAIMLFSASPRRAFIRKASRCTGVKGLTLVRVALIGSGLDPGLPRARCAGVSGAERRRAWRTIARGSGAERSPERYAISRVTTDWRVLCGGRCDPRRSSSPRPTRPRRAVDRVPRSRQARAGREADGGRRSQRCDADDRRFHRGGAALMVAALLAGSTDDGTAMRDRIAAGAFGEIVKTCGYGVHAGWGPKRCRSIRHARRRGAPSGHGSARHRHRAGFVLGDPAPESRVCAPSATRYGTYSVDDDGIILIAAAVQRGRTAWSNRAAWHPHRAGWRPTPRSWRSKGYARLLLGRSRS